MNIEVLKYGGTSLATIDKMKEVADFISEKDSKVIVVVSAMNKETDELLSLANQANPDASSREIDMLITCGEQKSAAILSMLLNKNGVNAISLNSFQAKINVHGNNQNSKINSIDKEVLDKYLQKYDVLVVTGFQGVNGSNDICTLGRGGSDTSCICLAATYNVPAQIFTDTSGIFTANPTVVKNAFQMQEINFDQMMEMAIKGSGVMEVRSIEIAKKNNIDIYVGLSPRGEKRTKITNKENDMETKIVNAISEDFNCLSCKVTFDTNDFNLKNEFIKSLLDEDLRIDFVKLGANDFSFTIDSTFEKNLIKILQNNYNIREYEISDINAKVTVVGVSLSSNVEVLSKICDIANKNGIGINDLFTTDISISLLIGKDDVVKCANLLAEEFKLIL